MHFFKRQLTRLDTYYILIMNKNAVVVCFQDGDYWVAHMNISAHGSLCVARGRTPREALRKLEKKTTRAVQAFVSTFASVFREVGLHFKKAFSSK